AQFHLLCAGEPIFELAQLGREHRLGGGAACRGAAAQPGFHGVNGVLGGNRHALSPLRTDGCEKSTIRLRPPHAGALTESFSGLPWPAEDLDDGPQTPCGPWRNPMNEAE